jgi:hypothetical protein
LTRWAAVRACLCASDNLNGTPSCKSVLPLGNRSLIGWESSNALFILIGLLVGILLAACWWLTITDPVLGNEPLWMRTARAREQAARRPPKWLGASFAVGILSFFAGLVLFITCFSSNPREPDTSTGHTYEMNNHGDIVYVTKADYLRINGMIFGGVAIGMAGGLAHSYMERRSSPHCLEAKDVKIQAAASNSAHGTRLSVRFMLERFGSRPWKAAVRRGMSGAKP